MFCELKVGKRMRKQPNMCQTDIKANVQRMPRRSATVSMDHGLHNQSMNHSRRRVLLTVWFLVSTWKVRKHLDYARASVLVSECAMILTMIFPQKTFRARLIVLAL